jgi:hypothetical protein
VWFSVATNQCPLSVFTDTSNLKPETHEQI